MSSASLSAIKEINNKYSHLSYSVCVCVAIGTLQYPPGGQDMQLEGDVEPVLLVYMPASQEIQEADALLEL